MKTLEEIKNAIVDLLDEAWHALAGTVDVDKAREIVAHTTSELAAHASAVGQHLFDHVLGNASAPAEAVPAGAGAPAPAPAADAPTVEPATGGAVSSDPVVVGDSGPETLAPPADSGLAAASESGPVA